jgi:hypothetical protein
LDGDLPKENYFTDDFQPKLSELDGAIHTVVPGRIVGIGKEEMQTIAKQNIHLHLYTENYQASREFTIAELRKAAPEHFHIHPHCRPLE